jgi:uridine kinase
MRDDSITELSKNVLKRFYAHHDKHIFTVAISGIDASGKGYVAKLLQDALEKQNLKVANINIDPWQNPISLRLQKKNPVENFYKNVFRWDDFFSQLILSLQKIGSIYLETMLIRTHADQYYPFTYNYNELDILLIEGIFLFKKEFLTYYDLKIWINCSFEKGIQRAIDRNVERINKQQLIHDYNTYYYPAQRFHFEKDRPKNLTEIIYCNDELLGTVGHLTFNSPAEI